MVFGLMHIPEIVETRQSGFGRYQPPNHECR